MDDNFRCAIAAQLRAMAEQDDQLGRGEFELVDVIEDDWDSFAVVVLPPGGESGQAQTYRITVTKE